MKKHTFKTFTTVSLIIAFCSCEPEDPNEIINFKQNNIETLQLSDDNLPESKVIATIQKDGMEYTFIELSNEDKNTYDIFLKGKVYDYTKLNDPSWIQNIEQQSPFNLFIEITNKNVSIPKTLAKMAGPDAVKKSRRTIKNSNTEIKILDPNFQEIKQKSSNCYNESESTFRNQRCLTPLNTNPDYIEFCDSGQWNSLIRNSVFGGNWRKLNEAFTWTNVICGSTRVKFYRHKGSWQLRKEVEFDNGIWYTSYWTVTITVQNPWLPFSPEVRTGSRLKVERRQTQANKSFRAYTRFRKKLYN
ncbi:hypothetical protein [uncultured Aquimarina sp.]|uniref:hypothetical protein n=1 Tax=uncultured Aquimarina sp. TaxID=575652 RepID=UPI002614CE7F|nr:hypothetical protein [uncultured Aquimarina sp.]